MKTLDLISKYEKRVESLNVMIKDIPIIYARSINIGNAKVELMNEFITDLKILNKQLS